MYFQQARMQKILRLALIELAIELCHSVCVAIITYINNLIYLRSLHALEPYKKIYEPFMSLNVEKCNSILLCYPPTWHYQVLKILLIVLGMKMRFPTITCHHMITNKLLCRIVKITIFICKILYENKKWILNYF